MKNFLRTIPIHSFLIGLYVILFIYIRNTNKTSFSSVYRSILVELAVTVLVFAISYLLLRSARKTGIFATLLLIGLFIYGILYNKLEALYYNGYWPFSHIHRFLLIFYFLVYALLFVFFFRSKRPHYNLNYILNSFVLILFLMNLPLFFLSLKNETTTTQSNKFLAINSPGYKNIVNADNSFPDVYYIILDGYANEKILKDFYLDKTPLLYQYLRKRGFYIADSSRANYPFTALSLSSSLNLGYLDSSISNTAPTNLIKDNTVNYIFKKANYKLINIESGFAITEQLTLVDKTISAHSLNEFETRLVDLTILRLDDVLGFSHYKRLKNVLNGLGSFLHEKGPKFCFIHIVSPHPPYVVDSAGKRMVRTSVSDMAWEPRTDYWQQLQYTSKEVIRFIDQILRTSKKEPVIILQSDHGPWIQDKDPQNVYEARSRILNAYYVPDSIKNVLHSDITPVNSFRILFSHLFKANYPSLPDKPFLFSELKEDITFRKYND